MAAGGTWSSLYFLNIAGPETACNLVFKNKLCKYNEEVPLKAGQETGRCRQQTPCFSYLGPVLLQFFNLYIYYLDNKNKKRNVNVCKYSMQGGNQQFTGFIDSTVLLDLEQMR